MPSPLCRKPFNCVALRVSTLTKSPDWIEAAIREGLQDAGIVEVVEVLATVTQSGAGQAGRRGGGRVIQHVTQNNNGIANDGAPLASSWPSIRHRGQSTPSRR